MAPPSLISNAAGDQVVSHRCLVGSLEDRCCFVTAGRGNLFKHRARVVVLRPNAFEVEDGEATSLVHGNGEGWVNHRVHGRSEERDGKAMGPDLEPHFDQFRIDGDFARDDGDVIEPVGAAELLELRREIVVHRRRAALRMFGGGGRERNSSTQVSAIQGMKLRPWERAACYI